MGRTRTSGKVEQVGKTWLSPQEACAYLGCSLDLLERLRNEAQVSFARYGSRMIWYELRSINRFLERNRVI